VFVQEDKEFIKRENDIGSHVGFFVAVRAQDHYAETNASHQPASSRTKKFSIEGGIRVETRVHPPQEGGA